MLAARIRIPGLRLNAMAKDRPRHAAVSGLSLEMTENGTHNSGPMWLFDQILVLRNKSMYIRIPGSGSKNENGCG